MRGYKLNESEKITRDIINSIMCNYYVDFSETAKKFKTEVKKIKDIVGFNDEKFKDFVNLNFIALPTVNFSFQYCLFIAFAICIYNIHAVTFPPYVIMA